MWRRNCLNSANYPHTALPLPRKFTKEEIADWIAEDESVVCRIEKALDDAINKSGSPFDPGSKQA